MIDDLRNHLHYDEELAIEFYVLRHHRDPQLEQGLASGCDVASAQIVSGAFLPRAACYAAEDLGPQAMPERSRGAQVVDEALGGEVAEAR